MIRYTTVTFSVEGDKTVAVTALRAGGIDLLHDADGTIIRLWGEIDASLRGQASRALAGALAADAPVTVDASGVTFMDSSGAAFIMQLCALEREEGVSVMFTDPPSVVSQLLSMICGPEQECLSPLRVA